MRLALILLMVAYAGLSRAETVFAGQTLRAGTILTEQDMIVKPGYIAGALQDTAAAVGMEARVVLYAGRPIRESDITPPAVIRRNQAVELIFRQGGLAISTGGRALDRGAVGDSIRVMNTSSRKTLFGRVLADGRIDVSSP